jgi:GNAT superfamily N-acetyltransferase
MLIEERRPGDASLTTLLDAAFQELVDRNGAQGRSPVKGGARYLVALVEGRAVGCDALQPTDDPHLGELKRMYVVPEYRGRGIAAGLLSELESLAGQHGYRGIQLATGIRQPEAIALYRKHGYEPVVPYGKYIDDPFTRCFLKTLVAAEA